LLRKSEYHRFFDVRYPEKYVAHRGEILGVVEYNGHAVVLQDGPREYTETEREGMYGTRGISVSHIVLAHEIHPEQAPEMETFVGHIATMTTDDEGDIELTDVCNKEQERERSRSKGFSR
jgi:hypothetical protein